MIDWVIYITIGIVVGFAAGYFISRLDDSMKRKVEDLESKLENARQEMNTYKKDVTQHFIKTSSLINDMTDSYRAVYDHMADGAKNLCSNGMIEQARLKGELDIPTAKLIETATTEPTETGPAETTESTEPHITEDTGEQQQAEATTEEITAEELTTQTGEQTEEIQAQTKTPATGQDSTEAFEPALSAEETQTGKDEKLDLEEMQLGESVIHDKAGKGPDKDTTVIHH